MKTFKDLKALLKQESNQLLPLRAALLGDTSTQLLSTALKGMAVDRGFRLDLFEADYNQVERQVLDATSELHQLDPEFLIVFQSTHKLLEKFNRSVPADRKNLAEERLSFVENMCRNTHSKVVYYNYPEIDDTVFGNFANRVEESFVFQLRKLNYELMLLAQRCPNLYICDLSSIQNKLGRDSLFSAAIYVSTEMVLSIDALPTVASRTIDILCAHKGMLRKCLILDLDNTLWGGIIGDDGLENIQLGHGLGIGKAFTEFQEWVRKLKERGILLAIVSKNTESVAREPFEKHPEMVLRMDDIAVFVANWENKADNIRQVQSILNIGFDSMVFLDDNPFERNMVRENVHRVLVPELPEDPADYLEYLYGLNLFETVSHSPVDADRTRQYQVEAQRLLAQKSFTNESDFLHSLEMTSTVEGFHTFNTPRIAQLSQRSNQFNLRTVRYSETELDAIAQDSAYHCFSFTLQDKLGDHGLICAVVLRATDSQTLFIDNWFMSCRVLKRGMEQFVLNTLAEYAKDSGYQKLEGEYLPTPKNTLVADLYPSLGFQPSDGGHWLLSVENHLGKESPIQKNTQSNNEKKLVWEAQTY